MGLFKRKAHSGKQLKQPEEQQPVNDTELKQQIETNKAKLSESSSDEEQATLYEAIGIAQFQLDNQTEAIESLEKSLAAHKSLGEGYKTLLRLYNKQRAEAAASGDEVKLTEYMQKIDELMQISKDITRGKF